MKIYKRIFILAFFIIIALPFVGLLFYKEPENTENKTLSALPQIREDGKLNKNYLGDLSGWFDEHFAFRQELVTLNAEFKGRIFKESSEDLAIVGTDGWLYLSASLPDYQGTNLVSERRINNVITTIRLMQEYVEGLDKTFVFTCAPNKNTLYPEHMPYYYTVVNKENNLDRITPYLKNGDINYVDLKALFLSREEILYHKGDSHWNNKGAAMVKNSLLEAAGKEYTDFTNLEYETVYDFEGDIDKILYPRNRHREEEYDYSEYMSFSYTGTSDVTAVTVETVNDNKENGLLCYRDSFGNSLLPFLADEFKYSIFSKAATYRLDLMEQEKFDICIIEVVERNLMSITKFAPVMPAPLREFKGEATEYNSDISTIDWTKSDNYYKIVGCADESYVSDDSFIYIRLVSEEKEYIVEAFPADERDLNGKPSDYGFTAYIRDSEMTDGIYEVWLITAKGGINYTTKLLDGLDIK